MEEIKEIASIIADIPNAAVWLIFIYFMYKALIVGSLYGVIKFTVERIHLVAIKKQERPVELKSIPGVTIYDSAELQLARILVMVSEHNKSCAGIHKSDADWLLKAVHAQILNR